MTGTLSKDQQDALAALDRLVHRHKLVTLEQAQIAARAITGDDAFVWPPPAPAPAPEPAAAPEPQPEPSPPAAPAPAPDQAPDAATPE